MKRGLMTLLMSAVALLFTSCELLLDNPDRVITQGEIAGAWSFVYSGSWEYGTITIDEYGNFTMVSQGSGVTPTPEEDWVTTTGTMTIAGGNATITVDDQSNSYKIKASKFAENRWLLDPYSGGMAYMAFGDCDDLGMFGSGDW